MVEALKRLGDVWGQNPRLATARNFSLVAVNKVKPMITCIQDVFETKKQCHPSSTAFAETLEQKWHAQASKASIIMNYLVCKLYSMYSLCISTETIRHQNIFHSVKLHM